MRATNTTNRNNEELNNLLPTLFHSVADKRNKEVELTKKITMIENVTLNDNFANLTLRDTLAESSQNFEKIVDFDKKSVKNCEEQTFFITQDEEKGLIYVVTTEKKYLDQYFSLRNAVFRNERGWNKKTWFESEYDKKGHIILALDKKKKVIGGARLMVSTSGELVSGEIPATKFIYRNLFKEMGVNEDGNYGEIDGLVVCEGYRDRSVTEKILESCIKKSLDLGCAYLVGIASPPYCRIYRSAYKAIGYESVSIFKDFIWAELEEYNFSRDCPIVNIINKNLA